jgi:hypothetical protein
MVACTLVNTVVRLLSSVFEAYALVTSIVEEYFDV